ncbi:hypothetical protein H7I94_05495, partial [Mycobacterium szulgai]|nr:hypothetical protein [Mycobacterium szulgai]
VTTRRSAHGFSVNVKVAAWSQDSSDIDPYATITPGGVPAPGPPAAATSTTRSMGYTEYFSIRSFLYSLPVSVRGKCASNAID